MAVVAVLGYRRLSQNSNLVMRCFLCNGMHRSQHECGGNGQGEAEAVNKSKHGIESAGVFEQGGNSQAN